MKNCNRARFARSATGFSILELAIAMAAMLILAGIALPSINRNLRIYELGSAATRVADQLKATRFEAIRRNIAVNCITAPAAGNYRMWSDSNGNGAWDNTERLTLLTGTITLLPAASVPTAGNLPAALGVAAVVTRSGSGANQVIGFDPRGAVTGAGVNVFYVGNPALGIDYRAVVLMPSGSTQIWVSGRTGAWHQAN